MIRILQIVPTLGYGGVAQFLLNYYKQMDKNEIRFDFITHGSIEAFHQELIDGGSQIFYFKSIGKEGLKYYLKQLKDVFENNTYDIVHTHDGHLVGLTAFSVADILRVRLYAMPIQPCVSIPDIVISCLCFAGWLVTIVTSYSAVESWLANIYMVKQ